MLTQPQVQRYSTDSGLRDIMIAEKEVMLTFLLQLLSERGILDRLAFKGGTCLRKMFIGSQGRFSTDLDFTGIEEHDHEDVILEMMEAFQQPFHGIQFAIPDGSYYETLDGLSWGVNPTYSHDWNASGVSEVKLQISRRETPTLPTVRLPQIEQSYFKLLPFVPAEIVCLALPEILAEKIRACYQRNKARVLERPNLLPLRFAGVEFMSGKIRQCVFGAVPRTEKRGAADQTGQAEAAWAARLATRTYFLLRSSASRRTRNLLIKLRADAISPTVSLDAISFAQRIWLWVRAFTTR
jgi:predicted nucleotidyltransferase component of viral defense system